MCAFRLKMRGLSLRIDLAQRPKSREPTRDFLPSFWLRTNRSTLAAPVPPAELVSLLADLQLATPAQVARAARRTQRLCRGLPLLDHAWVDALVQSGRLTPFQGAEIQAGRGRELLVGDWLLTRPLPDQGLGRAYLARRRTDGAVARVVLSPVAPSLEPCALEQLQRVATAAASLAPTERLLEAGAATTGIWSAWPAVQGRSLAALVQQRGRLPVEAVEEIARQMAAKLARMEQAGLVHGDLRADQVLLSSAGEVLLLAAGLRSAVRPRESLVDASLDALPVECFDGLAPERAQHGETPLVASDLFACGALWWQLLCGRAPLPAADARQRLQRAASESIPELTTLVPEAPATLALAVRRLTAKQPNDRPASFAEVCQCLGPPSSAGRRLVRRCLSARQWSWSQGPADQPMISKRHAAQWAVAASVLLAALGGYLSQSQTPLADRTAVASTTLTDSPLPLPGPGEAVVQSTDVERAPQRETSEDPPNDPPSETPMPQPEPLAPPAAFISRHFSGVISTTPEPELLAPPAAAAADNSPTVRPMIDPQVQPAAHEAPQPSHAGGEVLLPIGRPLRIRSLNLSPGQTVRGQAAGRPLVVVPAQGLAIRADDVTLVGIDFLAAATRPVDVPLLWITARRVTLRDCTFQGAAAPDASDRREAPADFPAAVVWQPGEAPADQVDAPPRLAFDGCCWRQVACGVRCETPEGDIAIIDCLHLGPGPWLELPWPASATSPRRVTMERATLRNATSLLQLDATGNETAADGLSVALRQCVLAPAERSAGVIAFSGSAEDADAALSGQWEVQDCVLARGHRRPFVTGMATADLEFAGAADDAPQASLLLQNSAAVQGSAAPQGAELSQAPAVWPQLPATR